MPSVEFQNMLYGCEYRFNRVRLRTIRLNHPGGATGYRLEYAGRSFCYITDVEHKIGVQDVGLVNFLRGADVLVYDSTYTDSEFPAHVGWGHSTWQEAVRLGLVADVEHTVLFHHDPSHDDVFLRNIESELAGCAARVSVARDGLRMSL
jgi:phosphoribosyl 1,2-cyclic phosphodiesterase